MPSRPRGQARGQSESVGAQRVHKRLSQRARQFRVRPEAAGASQGQNAGTMRRGRHHPHGSVVSLAPVTGGGYGARPARRRCPADLERNLARRTPGMVFTSPPAHPDQTVPSRIDAGRRDRYYNSPRNMEALSTTGFLCRFVSAPRATHRPVTFHSVDQSLPFSM